MSINKSYIEAIELVLNDAERQLLKTNVSKDTQHDISESKIELLDYIKKFSPSELKVCNTPHGWKFAINLTP